MMTRRIKRTSAIAIVLALIVTIGAAIVTYALLSPQTAYAMARLLDPNKVDRPFIVRQENVYDQAVNNKGICNFNRNDWEQFDKAGLKTDEEKLEFILQPVHKELLEQAVQEYRDGKIKTLLEFANRDPVNDTLRTVEYEDYIPGLSHAEAVYAAGLWPSNGKFQFQNYINTSEPMQNWSVMLIKKFAEYEDGGRQIYDSMLETLWSVYDRAEGNWWIEKDLKYTSMMHQKYNGIAEGFPLLINEETQWEGGHFLCFELDGKTVKYRIECGYQPCDIPPWKPDPPSETTTTTTTAVTTSTPDETTTTTVTTTLQPKNWPDTPEPNTDGQGSQDSQMTDPTPEPNPDDYATTTTKATTTRRTTTTTRPPVTTHPPVTTTAPPLDSEVDVNPQPTETGGYQPNDGNDGDMTPPS